jgi:ATP-dependent DNA helicase PIF1
LIKFTEGQNLAMDAMVNGEKPVMVLGKPGTGKSTLLKQHRAGWGFETLYCATTGVANQQLFDGKGGSGTLNRVLSLPTKLYNQEDLQKINRYTSDILQRTDAVQRIVVDEAGMISPDSFELIGKRLSRFNRQTTKRVERNIQLCLIADLLQIPNILSKEEAGPMIKRHGTHLFFKTKLFEEAGFDIIFLNEVKRTSDQEFAEHLDVLRYGDTKLLPETLKYFNQRYGTVPSQVPVLSPYNQVVAQVNHRALLDNPNPCGVYRSKVEGDYNVKNCPADTELRIKEGLPVITLVNEENGLYNNGSSGIVEQLTSEGVYVKFNATGETHLVAPHKFYQTESYVCGTETTEEGEVRDIIGQRVTGSAECIPLKLAAGMTCHRAQGRTIDSPAIVDLGRGFNRNGNFGTAIAYVALSRFTRLEDIFLAQKLNMSHVKVCRETIEWMVDKGFT